MDTKSKTIMRFTCNEAMHAHLSLKETTRDAWVEAESCLKIAKNPQGRFGLTPEQTEPVIAACELHLMFAIEGMANNAAESNLLERIKI